MPLVESLLTAIVRADGDALVMHVGERPYVVASAGPIELSTQGLNLQAMTGMTAQLLPAEAQRALSEFGAVEHELPSRPEMHGDRFTVVVARGGDDVWIEIRRHRRLPSTADPALVPLPAPEATTAGPVAAAAPIDTPAADERSEDSLVAQMHDPVRQHVEDVASAEPQQVNVEPIHPMAEALPSEPAAGHAGVSEAHRSTPPVVREGGVSAPAAVIPMTRTLRIEVPHVHGRQSTPSSDIERLLSAAAARGASALYMTTHASPYVRVDADMHVLEGEPPLSPTDVEAAALALMPEPLRDGLRHGDPAEWVSELAGIGPVRCSTFRDHRGPGAIFQLISMRPIAADQLGLSAEIQALTTESEGLVLVASARANGKTTLVGSLVDLINRQRPVYVITLERQIQVVHDHRAALISQREVRGTTEESVGIARAALRENPDVLVVEDLSSADMLNVALDAAGTGVLVIASVTAASATAALTRIVEFVPPEKRRGVQSLLAERLRGVIAQTLLRRIGGGRAAAREVVLPTAAITSVIANGPLTELPLTIATGRNHGLVALSDALVELVRAGIVDLREAYRKADDRDALVAALKRENVDPGLVERLA